MEQTPQDEKQVNVIPSVDTNDNNVEEMGKDLIWDELLKLKDETKEELLGGQNLVMATYQQKKNEVDASPELTAKVNGLLLSYKDIALDLREAMNQHMTIKDVEKNGKPLIEIVDWKKGVASTEDDQLEYIRVAAMYTSALDNIAGLSAAYLDILLELKIATPEDIAEANKIVEEANAKANKIQEKLNGANNV
jgi:hypothetical protein